jgi:hypothetical protein
VTGDPVDLCGTNTALSITDAGISVYILKAQTAWQMGQWKMVTFDGVYYPNLGS